MLFSTKDNDGFLSHAFFTYDLSLIENNTTDKINVLFHKKA